MCQLFHSPVVGSEPSDTRARFSRIQWNTSSHEDTLTLSIEKMCLHSKLPELYSRIAVQVQSPEALWEQQQAMLWTPSCDSNHDANRIWKMR